MKKFLCYDTNDAASGKIGVNSNGVLSPNATVPSTNGSANQQLVTDGDGNVKWEDRLALDVTLTVDGKAADAKAVGDALSTLSEETDALKQDLNVLFDNLVPLLSNAVYIRDDVNQYLENIKNRVPTEPTEPPKPTEPPEPTEPALYSFVNGTHTFADGSILTVSNGNHVKLECKTTAAMNSGKTPFFGISDIQNANYGTSNALYNRTSTYSTDPMFTIDSGDLVEIWVKNVSSTNNKHSFKLNMRSAVQNGGSVIPDSFSVNYTMSSTVSKTFEASSTNNIAPFYVFFNYSEADAVYEFDVELFVNGTRFI